MAVLGSDSCADRQAARPSAAIVMADAKFKVFKVNYLTVPSDPGFSRKSCTLEPPCHPTIVGSIFMTIIMNM
jgi:hypothetical protein